MPSHASVQPDYGSSLQESLHVRLLQARRVRIDAAWQTAGVQSTFWRLYVNGSDGAAVRVDGRWHALAARRVYLVPAWVKFDCRCDRTVDHLYLHFDVVGLAAEPVRGVFDRPLDLGRPPMFGAMLGQLRRACGPGDPTSATTLCLAKATVFLALSRVLAGLLPGSQQRLLASLQPGNGLQPALRWVEENLHRRISNAELARACHISEAQLSRRFRHMLKQSPGQYVLDRRISLAAEALTFTDQTIEQIAQSCGFPNRFYFTRVFRQHMSLPPAAYRQQQLI